MWAQLLKLVGWGILLAYLANEPAAFEPLWVGFYLAICLGGGILALLVLCLWPYIARSDGTRNKTEETSTLFDEEKRRLAHHFFHRPVLNLLLVPGEDGLFFVPLLLVGVTWLSALPVAVLFGFVHYNNYSAAECAGKAAFIYLCCLLVLPHGILNFAVGHFLLDAAVFLAFMVVFRADYLAARGERRYLQGDYKKAIADLSEAIRLNPNLEYGLYSRGHAWVAVGEFDRALADYDAALALKPCSAETLAARGAAWCRKGRHDEALADFEQALELKPLPDWALNERARIRHQRGECDLAIADYTEALRLQPGQVDYLLGRSTAYNEKGDFDKALADCESAIEKAPTHVLAYSNLGWTFLNMGHYQEGIHSFEKGLALDANCSLILDSLAWILATCPDQAVRDGKKALAYAQRLNDRPDLKPWSKLKTLAAACAECGDYAEAVAHLTAALESMPEPMKTEGQVQAMLTAFQAGSPYFVKPRSVSRFD